MINCSLGVGPFQGNTPMQSRIKSKQAIPAVSSDLPQDKGVHLEKIEWSLVF